MKRLKKLVGSCVLATTLLLNPSISRAESVQNSPGEIKRDFNSSQFYAGAGSIGWKTKGRHSVGFGSDNPDRTNPEDVRKANLDNTQFLRFGYRTKKFSFGYIDNLRFFGELNFIKTEYNRSQENLHEVYPIVGLQKDIQLFKYFILRPEIGAGVIKFDKYREVLVGGGSLSFLINNSHEIFVNTRYDHFGGPKATEISYGLSTKLGFEEEEKKLEDCRFELEAHLYSITPGVFGEDQEIDSDGACRSEFNLLYGKNKTRVGIRLGLDSLESKLDSHFADCDTNRRSLDVADIGIFIDQQLFKFKNLGGLEWYARGGGVMQNFENDKTFFPPETGRKSWEPAITFKTGLKFPISNSSYFHVAVDERYFPNLDGLDLFGIGTGISFKF